VILSACNTAAGDGTGGAVYSGLATAFTLAGAKALLLSHWRVRDDAAARLSVDTVRGAGRGLDRAEALRRAQVRMLGDRRLADSAHPAIWAPFVLIEN
jgi:CHAT domain-containing protein